MVNERGNIGQTDKVNPLIRFKCDKAVQLLRYGTFDIPDVQTWAEKAGVSRRWLCRSMKVVYGKPPKIILREMRYEKVVLSIREHGLNAGCYATAVDVGFSNDAALSRFLSSFYDTTFTKLKEDIVLGRIRVSFVWLRNMPKWETEGSDW
ncbi:MAG TPA: helix-turn-helix domain-containing protein [Balneolaceae bacterium]|nr:helix-turn-helix domain-containing protein [Balneolaceae bacterium]